MPSRHRSRERALQILYQWDLRQRHSLNEDSDQEAGRIPFTVDDAFDGYYNSLVIEEGEIPPETDEFTKELVSGVVLRFDEINQIIKSHSKHWRLERMPTVDRTMPNGSGRAFRTSLI